MFVHTPVKDDHMFLQKGYINPNWVLLDTGFPNWRVQQP